MRRDLPSPPPPPLAQRLAAEIFGTFFLTFVAAGGAMMSASDPAAVPVSARAAAAGLVVMAMIYTIGPISGAHLNPAITLAFAVRRIFPLRTLPLYWAAELAGALLAAGTLRGLMGNVASLGAPSATHGAGLAFGMELAFTLLLVSVVLGTATHHSIVGPNAALAVGGTIASAGLIAESIGGATLNPARSLAPMMVSGSWKDAWVWVTGPPAGALLGAFLARVLHGPHRDSERETAEGKDHA
jgi:aquaporin Z